MDNKINEEYLIVLKNDKESNQIIIAYEAIMNPFENEIKSIENLCDSKSSNLDDLIRYIANNRNLDKLNGYYKYCKNITGTHQSFLFSNDEILNQIKIEKEEILINEESNKAYDFSIKINSCKEVIKSKYQLAFKALSMSIAYDKCKDSNDILAYSHRKDGWSNPSYSLNENFSFEIKTNFGYGNSSYFYTIIKYKNIEITAFSDWVNYEIAKFSEIIRYSKSFTGKTFVGNYHGKDVYKPVIKNGDWEEAMIYARDACNLSLKNEVEFVDKYIIEECEQMVRSLEMLPELEKFKFLSYETHTHYEVDKKGHVLMEFRGEKISGALDFVSKIFEFRTVTKIDDFIKRIEETNIRIQPLLVKELIIIKEKLDNFNSELMVLEPEYKIHLFQMEKYENEKIQIKNEIIRSNYQIPYGFCIELTNKQFKERFPEFDEFIVKHNSVINEYNKLVEKIKNLNLIFENIKRYDKNITYYFETKKGNHNTYLS